MGAKGAALATTISYGLNLVVKLGIYYYLVRVPFWRVLLPGKQTMDILYTSNWIGYVLIVLLVILIV